MICDSCGKAMGQGLMTWHFECPGCGLEASTLEPVELSSDDRIVNEADREAGLEALRKAGFAATFEVLRKHAVGGALLDVGCAHGWFLDAGRDAGFVCTGIEPSTRVAALGAARGHRVLAGYFPDRLEGEHDFDVVSFNDVFEHIPGARRTMMAATDVLADGGLLSIAIPSSRGFFYRLSRLFARAGFTGPFDRMWQKHFSSPHLYYFNADVLTSLAEDAGLKPVYRGHLPSVRLAGLWDRLNYDTLSSRWKNFAIYLGVAIATPFLRVLPADIDLLVFQKKGVASAC